ncbi:MAG: DUF418 domain-containing protein [Nonomuraea sp.]|nr:DUF418 domain-containing protein [Nonomuraea sp.]
MSLATDTPRRARIAALDVIRGFALCGVLLANLRPISHLPGDDGAWMWILVDHRFFPIFSTLFGVGFSLMLERAGNRTALLRRLLALLVIGLAHRFLLWEGDILTIYAAVGLVFLLPSSWLPRRVVAALAGVLIVASLALGLGHFGLVPGLFLLGSALTRYGVTARLEDSTRTPLLLAAGFAVLTAPVLWMQLNDVQTPLALGVAGLLTAGFHVCAMLGLVRTPLRAVLRGVFEPLGKMALTNYLSASALVLLLAHFDLPVLVIAAIVLVVQWIWSTLWLRSFAQGPLEWLWRWVTWARRPPFRAS